LAADPPSEHEASLIAAAAPLVQERSADLAEAAGMLTFLFTGEDKFTVEAADAERSLGADAAPVLRAAAGALEGAGSWTTGAIEDALRTALVEKMGLKPRAAFGPVRVAVTGRRISPPLFESIELLGRDRALRRLSRALGDT
jgi:glutamyl-tRNA synthetase